MSFFLICREKKREREREELWKRLHELENSRSNQLPGSVSDTNKQSSSALNQQQAQIANNQINTHSNINLSSANTNQLNATAGGISSASLSN